MANGEMIERVARALRVNAVGDDQWLQLSDLAHKVWLDAASAAVAAMREPTKEMLAATVCHPDAYISGDGGVTQGQWASMIDEALK